MSNPFFSVIIPSYNRGRLIGETIKSFLKQTFKDFELIIIDDGSSDNTKELMQQYLKDPRISYIYQENKERGAARNRGAEEAKGTYLLFFDSDDIALPEHLEKAHEFIMQHGDDNVMWLHGAYNIYYKGNIVSLHKKPLSGWATKRLIKGNDIWICTLFIKADFFKTLLFDEDRELAGSEDWEFAIRASFKAPVFYQPYPTVLMRQHAGRSMDSPEVAKRSKLSVLNKVFSDGDRNISIKKYKHKAYAYGYLYIAIAYFSKNDLDNAKPFVKKALLSDPNILFTSRFLEWAVRIFLFPFVNFNRRFNRVLYFTYNGLCQPLGQSQVIPYIIGLSKQGYKFTILSFEHHYEKDFEKEYQKVKIQLDEAGIGWIALKYHKYPHFFSSVYDISHGIVKAILFYTQEPYYIIHARSYVPGMMALLLKKLISTKIIFDMRGMMADEKVDAGQWTRKSISYKITKLAEKKMLKNADAIVVLTNNISTYLKPFAYINAPITVIPTCVDSKRFPARDLPERERIRKELDVSDRLVVVYSGSLGTWYMFDKMVEYFNAVKNAYPKAFFLILNKSEHKYAKQFLESSGVEVSDYLIKVVSPDVVYKYLWATDIGIFFIKPSFAKQSSSPTKLAEYLACGLPVIGNSGVGDTEEIILGNNLGSIVYRFNDEEFKRAFEIALSYTREHDFQNRAREFVIKQMSVEVGVERYKGIYENL